MASVTSDVRGEPGTQALREQVAQACRILADQGLVENVLGHVSARVDQHTALVRCRGTRERGLASTTPDDIRLCTFDGQVLDDVTDTYRAPFELAIHSAAYRRNPAVHAVVHAHPRSALLAGLATIPLRPVFGAYNIPALSLARRGVPVWERSILITRDELASSMVEEMGDSQVCLLRGHGIVAVGDGVRQATVRAVDLHVLCEVTLELVRLGAAPPVVPELDLVELPDLGSSFNDELLWNYYVQHEANSRQSPAHQGGQQTTEAHGRVGPSNTGTP